tara:strand:+ start:1749 stop:1889 length:141 start_codon:yes stop_codon:yes gene_type:complete
MLLASFYICFHLLAPALRQLQITVEACRKERGDVLLSRHIAATIGI